MTRPTPSSTSPLFRAFSWADPERFNPLPPAEVLPTIANIRDLSAGAALVMQIIERDLVTAGDEDFQPMFDSVQQGDLLRWAIVSMQFVARDAGDLLSQAHTHHARPPGPGTAAGVADHSP